LPEISSEYAVQMRNITKRFNKFTALDKINIDIKKGEIHAILGENGAGKSTLMNILFGLYQADEGEIFLCGKKKEIKNPSIAIINKIGMVHQHFMLIDNFTVLQNIILGNEPVNKFGIINKNKARAEISEIIKKYKLEVDLDKKIKNISIGMQQRVEILKALYRGADLLILDEPTAVLTPQEIEDLIKIMRDLTKSGKTVIIITHKLKEIQDSSDMCTIIRRGVYIDTLKVKNSNQQELATKMVGRYVKLNVEKAESKPGEIIFEIDNIHVNNERNIPAVKGLSLKIHSGEILGIAGVDGNGQKELIEAVMSLIKITSGKIKIKNKEIQNTSVQNVINNKIATIHEDRQKRGLVLDFTVAENSILGKHEDRKYFNKHGILNGKNILNFTRKLIETYDIRPKKCEKKRVRKLSGGNQQKVIIGREISGDPDLLIAVQPTRGLDVGAIEYVHSMLIKERDAGKAVLLISLELDEIINLSDRIAVIYNGKIVGEFNHKEVTEEKLGILMAGGH